MKVEVCENHTFLPGLLPEKPVVLDLGGNQGFFSQSMARRYGATAFIVEPHPKLAAEIRELGVGQVLEAAASGESGTTSFFINQGRCASMLESMKEDGAGEVVVKQVTLQEVFDWTGVDFVDLLKVDIEGAELPMFKHSSDDLIRKFGQITIEFHEFVDPAQLPDVLATIKRLEGLGFHAINLSWHTHGDMLFINSGRYGSQALARLGLRTWKYMAGCKRMLRRLAG